MRASEGWHWNGEKLARIRGRGCDLQKIRPADSTVVKRLLVVWYAQSTGRWLFFAEALWTSRMSDVWTRSFNRKGSKNATSKDPAKNAISQTRRLGSSPLPFHLPLPLLSDPAPDAGTRRSCLSTNLLGGITVRCLYFFFQPSLR